MKPDISLDDLSLFLAVSESGSLSGAAARTGVSVPTLGRRMTRLEVQMERHLFLRGAHGYALTAEGRALAEEAADLRGAAARVERWRKRDQRAAPVRITAGHWTSRYVARNIHRVWSADAIWMPEFQASTLVVDIARRAADIGIRNQRPTQDWLAGRRTRWVDFAEYSAGPEVTGYICPPREGASVPSARWIWRNRADAVVMLASDARVALELAQQGVGRVILPVFMGDCEPGLHRVSDPIEALGNEEWLVSHHEARHDPPVRAALDALTALLTGAALRSTPA